MATLPTYYVRLFSGGFDTLENVTATPTLVPQTLMDAYYRDEDPLIVIGSQIFPDTFVYTTKTDPDTGVATVSTPAGMTFQETDAQMHVAPRQLTYDLSYWEFIVAPDPLDELTTFSYFYRWDAVVGMGTVKPSMF